jgi:hypothetical protein
MADRLLLVAGVADEEFDVAAGAVGQGLPRCDGQDLAVDGREEDRSVRGPAPALRPLVHLGADRVSGGGQLAWGNAGQVGHRGPQPQLGGAGGSDVRGKLRREERARRTLRDCPAEEPGRTVHRQQRGDRSPTRRLAENGDPVRVAAEGPDVVAHPLESGDLVEQAPVGRSPLDLREALDTHAVVERHHDDATVAREPTTVVLGEAGHADHVGAAMDPHHYRQPRARVGFGRPDVDRQPVVARRVLRQRVHAEMPALRGRRAVREGLPHPAPAPYRSRRGAAKRNTPTGGGSRVLPKAEDPGA